MGGAVTEPKEAGTYAELEVVLSPNPKKLTPMPSWGVVLLPNPKKLTLMPSCSLKQFREIHSKKLPFY